MSIESVMPSNHLILLPPSPLALSLSQHQGIFQQVSSYVYLWLIHVDVWQKPTQHCKAIILQLKKIEGGLLIIDQQCLLLFLLLEDYY